MTKAGDSVGRPALGSELRPSRASVGRLSLYLRRLEELLRDGTTKVSSGLLGESLGGGTAVELATRHDHRALVLVFTFTSLPAAAKYHYPWLPTHWLMRPPTSSGT